MTDLFAYSFTPFYPPLMAGLWAVLIYYLGYYFGFRRAKEIYTPGGDPD